MDPASITALHLDARNAANFLLATRLELRPNDVIFVAEQPVTRWNRVIQQIVPSVITSSIAAASG
jgi:polysaccharide export outer membrane protein